ncbi:MAG: CHAD domain-containing protein [Pseudomonadota bacterium]
MKPIDPMRRVSDNRCVSEIALSGSVEAVSAFRRSALIKALRHSKGVWARSVRTRFETRDQDLAARGFTIEIEETPNGRAQVISRTNAFNGILGQNEVTTQLDDDTPFPAPSGVFEFDQPVAQMGSTLGPRAKTTTEKWSVALTYRGALIDAAFHFTTRERWDAQGLRQTTPIAFVRLVDPKGRGGAVLDFARVAVKEAGLFPDLRALENSEESFDEPQEISRALKVRVSPDDLAHETLGQTIDIVANRLIELRPAVLERRDPRGLQQLRVALRRLRVIERLYRPYLTDPTLLGLAKRARRLTRLFGVARDWDVFLTTILPDAAEGAYPPAGFQGLRRRAEAERAEAWDDVINAVLSRGFGRLSIDLLDAGRTRPWLKGADPALRAPVLGFAQTVLDDALANALFVGADIDRQSLIGRHPLRIALKRVRYAAQTFRALFPKEHRKPYMAELSRFQEALGQINDVATAHLLADHAAKGGGDDVIRAAGFLYGVQAPQAILAAEAVDNAWAAFKTKTPFWRLVQEI